MNRTVGVALRRTVGGGAIFALSFGAFSYPPERTIAAADAATALPVSRPMEKLDEPRPRPARAAVMIYVEATPPVAAVIRPKPAPLTVRPMSRPMTARAAGAVSGTSNGFTYGYCTWWVANKRYVPWRGNAAQWWWNARPFGFAEGSTPRAGAIMVMGISGTSPQGHVAYVESVNPGGSFVVSEMNWWGVPGGGWGRVDYRTVTTLRGVLGFIY